MTLKQWELNNWLKKHSTNRKEIENLFKLVERDINSAKENTHPDWIFNIAYNAALKLCTILLYSSGYMAERKSNQYYTIQSITEILGSNKNKEAAYLDSCRVKRNTSSYDYAGSISEKEADELLDFVQKYHNEVKEWMLNNHPELLSDK